MLFDDQWPWPGKNRDVGSILYVCKNNPCSAVEIKL